MSLDAAEVISLLDTAIDKREEERSWQMWLAKYPHMTKDNFIPFSEFYKKQTQPISNKPAEDILREAAEIQKRVNSKKMS